jgi:hypothetical protein
VVATVLSARGKTYNLEDISRVGKMDELPEDFGMGAAKTSERGVQRVTGHRLSDEQYQEPWI